MNGKSQKTKSMSLFGVGLRFTAAVLLVFGTYNPSGTSYVGWLDDFSGSAIPFKILVGLIFIVGWVVFLRATAHSIGTTGVVLAVAVFGVLLWLLIDWNVIATDSSTGITYAVLMIISLILTIGMTGSFLWRRLTGQYTVTDGDDDDLD